MESAFTEVTVGRMIACATAAAALYAAKSLHRAVQLPPGPWSLPLIGHLPWIDIDHQEESQAKLQRRYGPICSYRLGQRLVILVSSYEMIKEMLKLDNFSGRLLPCEMQRLAAGCGIGLVEGKAWSEQRRVALKVLRDLGFHKSQAAQFISEEVDNMMASIAEHHFEVDADKLLQPMANSVIARFVFGRRFGSEDLSFQKFSDDYRDWIRDSLVASSSLMFPSLSPLLAYLPAARRSVTATLSMQQFMRQEIEKREAEITDINAEPACLCDAYIQERRRAEATGDFYTHKPHQLVRVCFEMFIAGLDTSARSVEWLLVYMSQYPEEQRKVQLELDEVIGSDRRPQLSDKAQLHYTQAVIDEGMRFASLVFNSVPHRAMVTQEFRGYVIPSDALILPSLIAVHRDPSLWQRPHEFFPGHFLDSEGHYLPSKYLVPFSVGKRVCPGESLARMEILIAFSAIMQRYTVSLSSSCKHRAAQIVRGRTTGGRKPAGAKFEFTARS